MVNVFMMSHNLMFLAIRGFRVLWACSAICTPVSISHPPFSSRATHPLSPPLPLYTSLHLFWQALRFNGFKLSTILPLVTIIRLNKEIRYLWLKDNLFATPDIELLCFIASMNKACSSAMAPMCCLCAPGYMLRAGTDHLNMHWWDPVTIEVCTNHHEPPRTTTNHHEPPRTTTNHHEPPRTTTNHQRPPRTTTHCRAALWHLWLHYKHPFMDQT